MQRSISYQNIIGDILWIPLFIGYIALSSIYPILPPMLAVLSFLFYRALSRYDLFSLIIISILLIVLEAEKGFWFGSSILFFSLLSRYGIPKLEVLMRCPLCIKGFFVFAAYPGYLLCLTLVNSILLLPLPAVDWHLIFYMAIEFALIAVFV